jgi:phosphoglycolate phosphatase
MGTMALMATHPLTIGFDLDMTLIDSRPGIHAAYRALAAETGVWIDADLAVTRLGPPLEEELAHWFPDERVQEMGDRYREIYPTYAIEPTLALPGAREAVTAVQELGGRAIVVTAKHEPNAKLHLAHLGMAPDEVIGWLWAEAKAEAPPTFGGGTPSVSTARVCTSVTTPETYGARTRPKRSPSRCRPGRATRPNCARPART